MLAEAADGTVTSTTLELLTKARDLVGRGRRHLGGNAAAVAGPLGDFGATTVYDAGDLSDALPGAPVAAAIAALIGSGDRPDAILIPASYDGRDIAGRLSAKIDRPVITNVVGLTVAGDEVHSRARRLRRGTDGGHGPVHRRPTLASSWSGPSRSRPRRPAAAQPRWSR